MHEQTHVDNNYATQMNAPEFLKWIDLIVEKSSANSQFKPCCSKGCHHCCSEALYVDSKEADWIVAGMSVEQRERVAIRTKQWLQQAAEMLRTKPTNDGLLDAFEYREHKIPCPLLEEGLCSVYDRRPMGCRMFLATGNPDDCRMPARRHAKIADFDVRNPVWEALMAEFNLKSKLIVLDHLGVLLAERLLNERPRSTVRYEIEVEAVHVPT